MIRVCYSNRMEGLIGALCDDLPRPGQPRDRRDRQDRQDQQGRRDRQGRQDLQDLEGREDDPFDHMFRSPWLIVPSRPLKLYLDLEIACRRGISGNLETLSLPGAFARLCAEALPDVALIERGHIVGELLAVLGDPTRNDHREWAPIHAYLRAAGDDPHAIDRRRVEIARALGTLFHDWTLDRPELMEAWRTGRDAPGVNLPPLERAERALWNIVFGPDGRFARRGAAESRRYLTLDAVLASRLDDAWNPPRAIHVFGLGAVPPGLQVALDRLGARTALTIYALNPCREFWEDLDSGRRSRARTPTLASGRLALPARRGQSKGSARQLDLLGLVGPVEPVEPAGPVEPIGPIGPIGTVGAFDQENPFLRLWGHAERETIRFLNQLTDGDFDDRFIDPLADTARTRPTLLRRIQRDLLTREPLRPGPGDHDVPPDDDSIAICGAPDPRRELESIAAEIWALIRADDAAPPAPHGPRRPSLRFSDIAVLIAGPEQPYLALLPAVFREANDLPHAVADQPLATSSHMVEALLALLALPQGSLSRREVLDVLTHPNVRARFPDTSPQVWIELCDALTIAHGADRAALGDTYLDRDVFNWDQGLKRLALGVFARGPRSGMEDPIVLPGPAGAVSYSPAEVAPDLRLDANALGLLVRSLLADVQFAKLAHLTLADWMRFVRALMSAYVIPVTPDDEAARLRILAVLDRIAAQGPSDVPVGLGIARDLLGEGLNDLRGSRGQILGAGVAVGTLHTLRWLPFRVLFVAGLGSGRFPTADRSSPLDLEAGRATPKAGTAAQRDRTLFLEAWLAARDKLILSYVDRDSLTGETREPSPVVLELLDVLRRGYLRQGAADPFRHVPLHRDEDPRICAAFPAAAAEAQARAVGERLRAQISGVEHFDPKALVRAFSPGTTRALAPLLRTIEGPAVDAAAAEAAAPSRPRRVLQLSDLRRFLECPLQGSARVFLGLRDLPDDADARDTTDEPFDVPRWLERSLLGDVFTSAWSGSTAPDAVALAACYDATTARHRAGRVFPAGLFRQSVRRRHMQILGQWAQAITFSDAPPRGPARRVCFGRPLPYSPAADARAPIRLTIDLGKDEFVEVDIHGTTEPQVDWGAATGSLVLATSASDKDKDNKDSLRVFLDHIALAASASPDQPPAPFVGAICRPTKTTSTPAPLSVAFAPLDAQHARDYLASLARQLLLHVHAYLFPCEAVFHAHGGKLTLVESINQIRIDKYYRDRSSSQWGPVPDPFEYPVPTDEDAHRMRDERFGLFLSLRPDQPVRAGKKKP